MMIKCPFIPEGFCVNIFGTYWVRDPSWIDAKVINHERIHTAQQRELLFIPFYILYGLEWLLRLMQTRHWRKAYLAISFEREAYAHGGDFTYLSRRRPWAWVRMWKKAGRRK